VPARRRILCRRLRQLLSLPAAGCGLVAMPESAPLLPLALVVGNVGAVVFQTVHQSVCLLLAALASRNPSRNRDKGVVEGKTCGEMMLDLGDDDVEVGDFRDNSGGGSGGDSGGG